MFVGVERLDAHKDVECFSPPEKKKKNYTKQENASPYSVSSTTVNNFSKQSFFALWNCFVVRKPANALYQTRWLNKCRAERITPSRTVFKKSLPIFHTLG